VFAKAAVTMIVASVTLSRAIRRYLL